MKHGKYIKTILLNGERARADYYEVGLDGVTFIDTETIQVSEHSFVWFAVYTGSDALDTHINPAIVDQIIYENLA